MKAILTGATGFIGQNLLPLLVRAGVDVKAISSQSVKSRQCKGVEWFQCDLFNRTRTKQLFDEIKPDTLIHLAWEATPGKYWNSSNNLIWADTTAYLLQLLENSGGKKVVIAGTCAEYDWSHEFLSEDLTPTVPRTLYGQSKNQTREYAQKFCLANQIDLIWARIFFPYGPGENSNKLIPTIVKALERDESVRCSHGQQYRDYIHISDVAAALCFLTNTLNISGVFNIASGIPIKLETLIGYCLECFTNPRPPNFGAFEVPPDDPMVLVGNIRKLEQLGWRPAIALSDGLPNYVNLLRK